MVISVPFPPQAVSLSDKPDIMPAAIQTPSLQRVEFTDFEKVVAAIEKDGAVILQNFTTPEVVERVNDEVKSYLDADKPWKVGSVDSIDIWYDIDRPPGKAVSTRDQTLHQTCRTQ